MEVYHENETDFSVLLARYGSMKNVLENVSANFKDIYLACLSKSSYLTEIVKILVNIIPNKEIFAR